MVAAPPIKTWFVVVPKRTPELLKKAQLISEEPPAPASTPQVRLPEESVSMESQEVRAVRRPLVAVREEAKKDVLVAPTKTAFVATKLVLKAFVVVALVEVLFVVVRPVKVARVPKRFVMVPWVAARTEEKKEVEVALVVVALVAVSFAN